MGGLDPAKIIMILVVALVVLGPERLPRAARQLGAMWRELSKVRERVEAEVRDALPDIDLPKIPALPRHGITGYLAGMMTSTDSAGDLDAAEGFAPAESLPAGIGYEASYQPSAWVSPPDATEAPSGVPAGWHAVGASAPGYASGSLLTTVPAGSPVGALAAEEELSFDEPGWN